MITWLIKSTNEFRLETMSDVEFFHKKLQDMAADGGFLLSSFSWAEKFVKEKGEVVDSYFSVKCTFVFNELKEPENPFTAVEFPRLESNPTIEECIENIDEEEDF